MRTVSIPEIEQNRAAFIFSTIPKWARSASVKPNGEVVRWHKRYASLRPDDLRHLFKGNSIAESILAKMS